MSDTSKMERVSVSATALLRVLIALSGPDHRIRELQALRGLAKLGVDSPIDQLLKEYHLHSKIENDIAALDPEMWRPHDATVRDIEKEDRETLLLHIQMYQRLTTNFLAELTRRNTIRTEAICPNGPAEPQTPSS